MSKALNEALRNDKARANVTTISELGLVEMTRKRTRESLGRSLTEPCFYCEGKGYLKSKTSVCYEMLRELRREGGSIQADSIIVTCHPEIADMLATSDQQYVDDLEKRLRKKIIIKARERCHLEEYEIGGKGRDDGQRDDLPRRSRHD